MKKRIIIITIFIAALVPAGYVADRYLSRPDRIRLDAERERLENARNAILMFTKDNARFPADLAELVPGYASEELLMFQPDIRKTAMEPLLWRPETGLLSWRSPLVVHGLLSRTELVSFEIPHLQVERDPISAENVFRQTPDQILLGAGDIIIEAELFQFMTYGWEIGEDQDASGQCYIHIREGTGDVEDGKVVDGFYVGGVEFDPEIRSGDFYNVGGDRRRIEARCYFMAPREGNYFVSVRTMSGPLHCSQAWALSINSGGHRADSGGAPFIWFWRTSGQLHVKKGLNYMSFVTHQDDVKIDQVLLTLQKPDLPGAVRRTFKGGHGVRILLPDSIPPVTMSLRASTLSISAGDDPQMAVFLRNNVLDDINATLNTSLDLPDGRRRERSYDIALTSAEILTKLPESLDLPRPLAMKEYTLRCELVVDSRVIQERTIVLFREYDWSVLGPLPFMKVEQSEAPEADEPLQDTYTFGGKSVRWLKYREEFTDYFCIMDFGRMFSGRKFDGMSDVSLYACTEVEAATGGRYLLKAQGDDNLVVWVNGERVVTIDAKGPPIRTARETEIDLKAGRNRILFRLNQKAGQWQAGIRIRTIDDQIADVTGVPFDEQTIDFYGNEK